MAKILIVDDSDSALKLISSVLTTKGHMVAQSYEPRDAIEKLKGEFFDLLITDVMMPGGVSGLDLTRTLRVDPSFTNLPIIVVTGRREKKDIEKGIESGADDYIVKPIDPEILISKVDSLLTKKPRTTEHFTPGAVKSPASWETTTEIVQITEVGLDVTSSLPVPVGYRIKLKSPFFAELGIEPPFLRVISCELRPSQNHYHITLHFVGLTEKEMTPIRLWIRSSKISR